MKIQRFFDPLTSCFHTAIVTFMPPSGREGDHASGGRSPRNNGPPIPSSVSIPHRKSNAHFFTYKFRSHAGTPASRLK